MLKKKIKVKRFYSKILITLFLLLPFSSVTYGSELHHATDSILNAIKESQEMDKLKLLEKHVFIFYNNPQLIAQLEEDARQQSNHLYRAYVYQIKNYILSKEDKLDSIKHYQDLIEKELQQYNVEKGNKMNKGDRKRYNSILYGFLYLKTELLLHDGKYDLALIVINQILDKAKQEKDLLYERQGLTLLGLTFLHTKKWQEALNSFEAAYQLNEEILNEKGGIKLNNYSYFQSSDGIIYSYLKMGKHQEVIKASDSLIHRIEKEYETIPNPSKEERFIHDYLINKIYSVSSYAHIQRGELKEARKQLDHVSEFLSDSFSPPHSNFATFYYAEAEYYILTKEYDRAKKNILALIKTYSEGKNPADYIDLNLLLAKILKEEGRSNEAYELLYDLYQMNDSINQANFSSQVAEIQAIHQVEKAQLCVNQENEKFRLTRIILITIFLVFILSLYLLFQSRRNTQKLKEKNIQLYNQYLELQERNRIMHKWQLEKLKTTTTKSDAYDEIIDKLKNYLSENKAYKNPELSREELAMAIGTNRQYLIQAIKEKTGKTFNEFIYDYRLKYAYEQIVNDRTQSISEIFLDSGFATRVTFNKLFKKAYGMSPSELRSVLEEI